MSENVKPGFFEDNEGNPSSMRLMSIIALLSSIGFGLISVLHDKAQDSENGVFITVAFLLAAFAPKAFQKFAENRFPPKT